MFVFLYFLCLVIEINCFYLKFYNSCPKSKIKSLSTIVYLIDWKVKSFNKIIEIIKYERTLWKKYDKKIIMNMNLKILKIK